jgi:hypothetical protein
LEQQKSGIPRGEHQEFEWTLFRALCARIAAEDTARKAADDAARQAGSNQNVQDDQGYGQEVNEDPDPVQTMPQDFRFPWNFVSSQLTNAKGDEILYPVSDSRDREWAKRLEWAIEEHSDIAEDDLAPTGL